ncbi:MAG: aminotransferase class I/II-fold pyridoxal phosphate-dependent enzyme [Bacteroidales bacterium]|nr:aminotransferase class I/II-fold pyridoxal phosphate-dependent enzyme [Bacteroidales bacterium]MBN2755653.1 aminotransferase class I/II-fold pyridoxal phosphate-dependent enzyme [Bacteroidales bacterium]
MSVDLFDKMQMSNSDLGKYREVGHGYYLFPKLEGEIAPIMKFRGKDVLNWSLNNYIGLANHPEVRKADADAAKQWGMAYPMGARMMSGQTSYHEELEQKLADFVSKKRGYLLNYGYQGIVSIIDSLLGRNDVAVYDSDSHASILDGLRLHMGKRYVFQHNDMDSFDKQMQRATKKVEETGGGILVVTEGVFGMEGDLGNLKAITDFKSKYNFRLLVDDAHGFGTMGKTGAGTGEHFGVQDKIDIYFSTFAKAMAGIGAFVAGDPDVINYLQYNMRSQIFAKSLPMPMVIGALKRLDLLINMPELRENLWTIVNALQKGLRKAGFDLRKTESPVTPVFFQGNVAQGTNFLKDLRENFGIFTSIVVYPVVPKGTIMLRIIPTASHTLEHVERTIKAFSEILVKLKAGEYDAEEVTLDV